MKTPPSVTCVTQVSVPLSTPRRGAAGVPATRSSSSSTKCSGIPHSPAFHSARWFCAARMVSRTSPLCRALLFAAGSELSRHVGVPPDLATPSSPRTSPGETTQEGAPPSSGRRKANCTQRGAPGASLGGGPPPGPGHGSGAIHPDPRGRVRGTDFFGGWQPTELGAARDGLSCLDEAMTMWDYLETDQAKGSCGLELPPPGVADVPAKPASAMESG